MSDDVRVTITLRRATAEKLRAMCHAKGETASQMVDRWIMTPPAAPPKKDIFDDMFGGLFGGRK